MNNTDSSSLNYGRQRIILEYDEVTPQNVLEILEKALEIHEENKSDCEYLIDYYLGKQDILNRTESKTSTINNQVVVNFAFPITREIIGYTLGKPIEFAPINMDKAEDIENLNKYYNYEEQYVVDTTAATYASVCGLGYYITLPSTEISKDNTPELPIVSTSLDPRYTFVVQSTNITNPQLMSCHYVELENDTVYTCYTDKYKFVITNLEKVETYNNPIGLDPITCLDNSVFLTGDWEQAISVMNASNLIASDSLNDIEGTLRSLLVVSGVESDGDVDETLKDIKQKRLLLLSNATGGNMDAKFISPSIESTSLQNIREYLDDARNIITGIPDRDSTSTGGDTGTAVLNRNGWNDIEIVVKLKELFIKKAKAKQLKIAIEILKKLNLVSDDLLAMDININIDRHNMDGLTARASAFSTLVATEELATIDCLELSGLTNRPVEMVERGKQQREERVKTNSQNTNVETENIGIIETENELNE